MRRILVSISALLLVAFANAQAKIHDFELKAADGQAVFARFYPADGQAKGVVLMFHQARSNMEEYTPIAPRVAKLGYDCVTIDQRSGGDMWGAKNRTAARYAGANDFQAAYADLEGALTWAQGQKYKKIVAWGSSYSASLTLRLASEHSAISAVLVFSPGEYFGQNGLVAGWNAKVRVPALFAFTKDESINGGLKLYDAAGDFPGRKRDVMVMSKDGVHGSSALREDRNPKSNATYWASVELFLKMA